MRHRSDAYTLTVRQAPQRAKAFPGAPAKEKDRKPVDPPPIVQLRIRDPEDPAQNYLQSPYFFMCCNLCDANLDRPGQISAGLQGDDVDTATQSALAGTLVSSLHRLKDVDNTDGGFFVFPDLSVKIEGQFRLRFSLFEMMKTRVEYITSVTSDPFTVFSHKTFPGLSESTFLSRSFGDQGVKLRIRKEPRVLGKRSAPSDFPPTESPHGQAHQSSVEYQNMGLQSQHEQAGGYAGSGYDEQPYKRQRMSSDTMNRSGYDQDQRLSQRSFIQSRDSYGHYPSRDPLAATRGSYYPQTALQTTATPMSEYSFVHQRNNSSSASSPFVSPRSEYPSYGFSTSNTLYQQPQRAQAYQYPQTQYTARSTMPELAQAPPSYRSPLAAVSSHIYQPRTYPRPLDTEDQSMLERNYHMTSRPEYQNTQPQPLLNYDRLAQPPARTLPAPAQSLNSVLPPLQSTLPSSQPRRDPMVSYPNGSAPNTEGNSQFASTNQSMQVGQNYMPQPYRG